MLVFKIFLALYNSSGVTPVEIPFKVETVSSKIAQALLAAPFNLNPNNPESVKWVFKADPLSMYDFLDNNQFNLEPFNKVLAIYKAQTSVEFQLAPQK